MTKHLSEPERRAQILDAAHEEFIEHGYQAARVEDVAKRAGLSKGAVYFYFPSKRALFMSLVREEHDRAYAFFDDAETGDNPAIMKLVGVGLRYVEYLAGLDKPPRFFMMVRELGMRDEEIRNECIAIHDRFVDAVTRILRQGKEEGSFQTDDPEATAILLKALIDGYAGQVALGIGPSRETLLAVAFDTVLRAVFADPQQVEGISELWRSHLG